MELTGRELKEGKGRGKEGTEKVKKVKERINYQSELLHQEKFPHPRV